MVWFDLLHKSQVLPFSSLELLTGFSWFVLNFLLLVAAAAKLSSMSLLRFFPFPFDPSMICSLTLSSCILFLLSPLISATPAILLFHFSISQGTSLPLTVIISCDDAWLCAALSVVAYLVSSFLHCRSTSSLNRLRSRLRVNFLATILSMHLVSEQGPLFRCARRRLLFCSCSQLGTRRYFI